MQHDHINFTGDHIAEVPAGKLLKQASSDWLTDIHNKAWPPNNLAKLTDWTERKHEEYRL